MTADIGLVFMVWVWIDWTTLYSDFALHFQVYSVFTVSKYILKCINALVLCHTLRNTSFPAIFRAN